VNSSIDSTASSNSPKNKDKLLSVAGLPLSNRKDSKLENHPYLKPGMGLKGLNVNQNKI